MRRTTLEPARGTRGTKNTKPQRGVFDGPAIRIDPHKIDADLKPLDPKKLKDLMAAQSRSQENFENRFFTRRDDGVLIANSPEDCKDDSEKGTLFSNNWKLRENIMAELFSNPEIAQHGEEWLSLLTAFVSGENVDAKNLAWDSSHNIDSQPANIGIHTNLEYLMDDLTNHKGNVNLASIVKKHLGLRNLSSTEKFFILQNLMLQHLYTDETLSTIKTGANIRTFVKMVNQLATPIFHDISEMLSKNHEAMKLFDGYFTYYSGKHFDLESARDAIKFTPYEISGDDVDDISIAESLVNQAEDVCQRGEYANGLRFFGYAYKLLDRPEFQKKYSGLGQKIKEAAIKIALLAASKQRKFTEKIYTGVEEESFNKPSVEIKNKCVIALVPR